MPFANSCILILQVNHFQTVIQTKKLFQQMEIEPEIDARELILDNSGDLEKGLANAEVLMIVMKNLI